MVEEKQALVRFHPQKGCHIRVVWKRGRKANKTDRFSGGLHLSDDSSDDALQHRTTVIVQQVNFVNNHELDQLGEGSAFSLSSDDVPLFWCCHQKLSLADLLTSQAGISGQLADHDSVVLQSLGEILDDLLHEGLHRGDVHNLEGIDVELLVERTDIVGILLLPVLSEDVHHRQAGDVRLSGTGGRTQENVFGRSQGRVAHLRLDAVELFHPLERRVSPFGELLDGDELFGFRDDAAHGWDVNFFVSLLHGSPRRIRQDALLVAHRPRSFHKRQRLEIQLLRVLLFHATIDIHGVDLGWTARALDDIDRVERLGHVLFGLASAAGYVGNVRSSIARPFACGALGMDLLPHSLSFSGGLVIERLLDFVAFLVGLRSLHRNARPDPDTIVQDELDGIEEIEAEQQQQLVLAFSNVHALANVEDFKHLGRQRCSLVGLLNVLGKLALEEVRVNFMNAEDAALFLRRLLLDGIALDQLLLVVFQIILVSSIGLLLVFGFRVGRNVDDHAFVVAPVFAGTTAVGIVVKHNGNAEVVIDLVPALLRLS
mmetsp:Transcript_5726/g.16981  ORF Transcript_5726/g.16981 Transcript_5726/m.16981 type:complete len:542 (-) Transcript_5726:814-2439(-)